MGLIKPRPPMRKAGAKRIADALKKHAALMKKYLEQGMSREEASRKAYEEMRVKKVARKQDGEPS